MVCILRNKKYDPENVKNLLEKKSFTSKYGIKKNIFKTILLLGHYTQLITCCHLLTIKYFIGDAFNGFLPTMAQGAGQSIESANELFDLIKKIKKFRYSKNLFSSEI